MNLQFAAADTLKRLLRVWQRVFAKDEKNHPKVSICDNKWDRLWSWHGGCVYTVCQSTVDAVSLKEIILCPSQKNGVVCEPACSPELSFIKRLTSLKEISNTIDCRKH